MGIETLNAMNEGMYSSLWLAIEIIMLMNVLLAIVGFAVYLVGTARLCFEKRRQSITTPRTARRALPPNAWESAPRAPHTCMTFTHEEPLLGEQQLQQGDRQRSSRLLPGADRHSPVAAPAGLGQ